MIGPGIRQPCAAIASAVAQVYDDGGTALAACTKVTEPAPVLQYHSASRYVGEMNVRISNYL